MADQFPRRIPPLRSLHRYNVNRVGEKEGIRSVLYDYQTYAAAGSTGMDFFQVPQGQSSKTLADTNMTNAGSLPSPQSFLIMNMQVYFWYTNTDIAQFGAQAAAEQVNDVYDVMKSGWLELYIGSKYYIQEAPIGRFPPKTGLELTAALADQSTIAADLQSRIAYANFGGDTYNVNPPLLLTPTQNFRVSLKWPSAVAVSGDARVGIVMEGLLYRDSQ